MKRWITWTAAGLVLVLLGSGAWRSMAARNAQQKALAAAASQREQAPLQLAADEILTVQKQMLDLGVPVSGALRAVDSAMVKARVAGELQGLTLREGDNVRAGQIVARIDPTESQARLRQALQQADAAKAQVDINQRQLDNNKALVEQGFISATALVNARASLQSAQATYEAARAAADVARKALDDTVLRAPIAGQVSQRLTQPGERVAIDGRVLEIVDPTRLELEALLSPADSLAVKLGQKAQLDLEGSNRSVSATVVRINPSAQAGNRAVPVYLRVDGAESNAALRQGLFVQGTLRTGQAEVLAVELDAVRTDKPQPYVQAVQNGRVAHLTVVPGMRATVQGKTLVAIEGALSGTRVLVGRLGSLREGTAVTPAAASAPSAAPAQQASQAAASTATR